MKTIRDQGQANIEIFFSLPFCLIFGLFVKKKRKKKKKRGIILIPIKCSSFV